MVCACEYHVTCYTIFYSVPSLAFCKCCNALLITSCVSLSVSSDSYWSNVAAMNSWWQKDMRVWLGNTSRNRLLLNSQVKTTLLRPFPINWVATHFMNGKVVTDVCRLKKENKKQELALTVISHTHCLRNHVIDWKPHLACFLFHIVHCFVREVFP